MSKNTKAEEIYKNLMRTKIPPFSGNDTLDDWIEDLIGYDTILAGLIARVALGEKLQPSEIPDVSPLKKKFFNIITTISDFAKIAECKRYLFLLIEVFDFLCHATGKQSS